MKASLIIPTLNRQARLCHTLQLALAQDYPDLEIIVIDQTVETSEELAALLALSAGRITYLRFNPPNLPAARNRGLAAAAGEIAIFIDDDVLFDVGFVSSHMRNHVGPETCAVMGLTLPRSDADQPLLQLSKDRKEYGLPAYVRVGDVCEARWILGGNTSVPRAAARAVCGFDEYYSGSSACEDVDFSQRLRRTGVRLFMDTRTRLIHLQEAAGGCEKRNADHREMTGVEDFRYTIYFLARHAFVIGATDTISRLWFAYRRFVLNRVAFKRGLGFILARHLLGMRLCIRAFRDARRGFPKAVPLRTA